MEVPKIGSKITKWLARRWCVYLGYDDIIDDITSNPDDFESWVFDGASMINDAVFAERHNIPNLTSIAFRHDLKYAYGKPKDNVAKLRADLEFALDVLNDGASVETTLKMLWAVVVFGDGIVKTKFSWGFARKKTNRKGG